VTIAISGGLSLLAGIGAAVWWSRIRRGRPRPAHPEVVPAEAPAAVQRVTTDSALQGRIARR
jgi:hypothetical protein